MSHPVKLISRKKSIPNSKAIDGYIVLIAICGFACIIVISWIITS